MLPVQRDGSGGARPDKRAGGAQLRALTKPFELPGGRDRLEPDAPVAVPSHHKHDLRLFEAMLAGRSPIESSMLQIAHGSGWPLRTGSETIFAFVSNEGPWRVATEASGWQPVEMERQGNLHFLSVEGDLGGRYKLVSPSGEWIADPMSRSYGYDEHGEYSRIKPPAGAHLERWPGLAQDGLLPRTVRVWVPKSKPTHHVYAHDGQNLFGPNTPWAGWKLEQTAGPSTLIVGIDCTEDRKEEYAPRARGDLYADFVRHRLQRFVEERYGQPRRRAIAGSSLGGLISVHLGLRYSKNYDFVACMSGTLGWSDASARIGGIGRLSRTKFYFDSGGEPGGGDNCDATREAADAFARAGFRPNRDVWYVHAPGAAHNESEWAKRAHLWLRLFERL
jgi:hypothetical protein